MLSSQWTREKWRAIPVAMVAIGFSALEVIGLKSGYWCPAFKHIAVLVVVTWATFTDLTRLRIPNYLTYCAFFVACTYGLFITCLRRLFPELTADVIGAIGVYECLIGAASCFVVMFLVWTLAGRGGGDVKLATSIGAFLGMGDGLQVILFAYVLAALAALGWLFWECGPIRMIGLLFRQIGHLLIPKWVHERRPDDERLMQRPIPMAAFFAIASILTMCGVTLQ